MRSPHAFGGKPLRITTEKLSRRVAVEFWARRHLGVKFGWGRLVTLTVVVRVRNMRELRRRKWWRTVGPLGW